MLTCAEPGLPIPASRMPTVGEYPNTVLNCRRVPLTRSPTCITTTMPSAISSGSTGSRRPNASADRGDRERDDDHEQEVRAVSPT